MIRYALTCTTGHAFESWFASAAGYDALAAANQLACPVCGTHAVTKGLMAPGVATSDAAPDLRGQPSQVEAALAAMRRHVEANSDYVGMNFAAEARKMHAGDAPERSIYGEARPEEAKALIEDGVPVAPLPFLPARKVN